MTVDTNSTALEQPLMVRSGVLAADIRTISDAAKFIRSLPADCAGRLHWHLAGATLEAADRNPGNGGFAPNGDARREECANNRKDARARS